MPLDAYRVPQVAGTRPAMHRASMFVRFTGACLVALAGTSVVLAQDAPADAPADAAADAPADAPADPRVPGIEALVAEALQSHPAVRRFRGEERAAQEVPSRVGSMPDPLLSFSLQNMRFDDPGLQTSPMTGMVFGLSQAIPFPGKLSHRASVAEATAGVARRQLELVQTIVEFDVYRRYWRLRFARRAQEVTAATVRVLDTLANVAHARFGVGQGAQQDVLQAQVAHSIVRAQLQERTEAAIASGRALNRALGRRPGAPPPPTGAPPPVSALNRSALVRRARHASPSIRLARAQVTAARETVSEAEYDRWPDLGVGVGYRLRGTVPGDVTAGADMFSVTLGITLPIWMATNQNARVRESRHRVTAANENREDAALAVITQLHQALDAVERLREELTLYENELLPETSQALDASIADYQFGRVQFVSVLQNWESELDAQLRYESLLAERAERMAEVRALVGHSGREQ